MIKAKFHEDPEVYRKAYRASVEQVLFVTNEPVPEVPIIDNQTT
jgi:hypothetical protein